MFNFMIIEVYFFIYICIPWVWYCDTIFKPGVWGLRWLELYCALICNYVNSWKSFFITFNIFVNFSRLHVSIYYFSISLLQLCKFSCNEHGIFVISLGFGLKVWISSFNLNLRFKVSCYWHYSFNFNLIS
jgi:hypothetical protein